MRDLFVIKSLDMPEREQARAKRPPMRGNHLGSLSFFYIGRG
jgi:hypothetical protein